MEQITNSLAPVVLFTYKRLDTLKLTVEALQKNYLAKASDLIIYSDGAKNEKDNIAVQEVRAYLKTITGFKSISINTSPINKGLANSIIQGVTAVMQHHEFAIVLEDDLISTPNFLDYMNQALNKFTYDKNVFSISGFSFNLNVKNNYTETYFLNRGWSWGWATWKSRWELVDWDIKDYSSFIKDLSAKRNFSKGGSDLNVMLKKQMTKELDSWAIRWFYNQFRLQGLTLYPVKSKIYNNGFGAEATHTTGSVSRYIPELDGLNKKTFSFPEKVEITTIYQKQFQKKMGYLSRIKSKIETLFSRL